MEENRKDAPPPSASGSAPALSDDYAATGMGGRTTHEVEMVDIDLESNPAARVTIRYEFHPQLVRLGVLPRLETPLDRRERAQTAAEQLANAGTTAPRHARMVPRRAVNLNPANFLKL